MYRCIHGRIHAEENEHSNLSGEIGDGTKVPSMQTLEVDHARDMLRELNEIRRAGQFCDVLLVAQGREFPAHRCVLAATKGFFRGLFATGMREQSQQTIDLPEIHPDIIEDVLGFVYTGKIEFTAENAHKLYLAVDFLLLEKLKAPLDEFMANASEDVPIKDIISSLQFATSYDCKMLKEAMLNKARKNFANILESQQCEEFLELDAETLKDILQSDNLVAASEDIVFQSVVNWVKHKEAERKAYLHNILSSVRLCALSREFVDSSVKTEELLTSSPECQSLLELSLSTGVTYLPTTANVPHARDSIGSHTNAILVFPSFRTSNDTSKLPWCYIPYTNTWYPYPYPAGFGKGMPVYHNGFLFLVKHARVSSWLAIDRLKLDEKVWLAGPQLHIRALQTLVVACIKGIMYIFGNAKPHERPHPSYRALGEDYPEDEERDIPCVCDIYKCDITRATSCSNYSYQIEMVAPMNTSRNYACVVSDDNFVYAFGGLTSHYNMDCLINAAERYDPHTNSWSNLSPMPHASLYEGARQGDKIFTIDSHEKSCMIYDTTTDIWSQIPKPPISMEIGIVAVCVKKAYVIGGYIDRGSWLENKPSRVTCVVYDMSHDTWTTVHSNHEYGGDYVGAVVVRLPKEEIDSFQLLHNSV